MPLADTTILAVDDNPAHNYALCRILEHAHSKVLRARTGSQALELSSQQPDLILLDVHLPDVNGFEVCRRLRNDSRTSHIPVVFVSATCQDEEALQQAEQAGGNGFLFEPFEPQQLVAVILGQIKRAR